MITTRDILGAIVEGGWKLAPNPFLKWVSNDRVIVYQHSDYGYSAFEMKIKGDRIVFFRVLSPYVEDAKKIEAMTLEKVILHIWGMAIASVRPDTSPHEGNVIRQDTLKWATFELNERMELSLQAGMKKVADYANNFAGIKDNPEWKHQLEDWGISKELLGKPEGEPFFTFYLIDLKKQNDKLFWRWTGTPEDEWKEIEDILAFLELYYPLKWRTFICKTMGIKGVE
jgi:hypothetical protein